MKRYREVSDAQAGMGRNSKEMRVSDRVRFSMKKISIVVSWSLENSVETTLSMESRGYGCAKRTHAHLFKWRPSDSVMLAALLIAGIYPLICAFTGRFRVDYFPKIKMMKTDGANTVALILMFIIMCIPMITDICSKKRRS